MKIKIFIGVVILVVIFTLYYFGSGSSFSGPVGGWEQSKDKIEAKYNSNEQVKLAALQLGEAYQKIIDSPDDPSGTAGMDDGMSCILGVSLAHGISDSDATTSWEDIRDIVISSREQQRRWIHYNANLSGGTYSGIKPDVSKCRFEAK